MRRSRPQLSIVRRAEQQSTARARFDVARLPDPVPPGLPCGLCADARDSCSEEHARPSWRRSLNATASEVGHAARRSRCAKQQPHLQQLKLPDCNYHTDGDKHECGSIFDCKFDSRTKAVAKL